jgi:uncharacterized protein (TIGR02246 family)
MRFIVILTLMFSLHVSGTMHFVLAQESKEIAGPTADHNAIEALVTDLVAASNANDVKAFADVFAADADFTNVVGQHAKGRSKIEEFHAPYYSGPRQPGRPSFVNAKLTVLENTIRFLRKDVAAVDIKWQQTGAISPDGQPWGPRAGLMNWIVTKEKGRWTIAVMHNTELTATPNKGIR